MWVPVLNIQHLPQEEEEEEEEEEEDQQLAQV
jgi:hypothetical protein